MGDIICRVPWHCGEQDCLVGWHLGSYWITNDGYTYDEFGDGDHEDIDEDEIPSYDERDDAWAAYWNDVVRTGQDPLGQLPVDSVRKVMRTWQVEVRQWIGASSDGLMLLHARRNARGPWKRAEELPKSLLDYLFAEQKAGRCVLAAHKSVEALVADIERDNACKLQRGRLELVVKFLVTIEERIPRSMKVVTRELQQAARSALASLAS